MNQVENNQNYRVSQWQLNKMKNMIAERWQEVWKIVEDRDKNKNRNR